MKGTVVVLVSGEALADGHGSTIAAQFANARELAEGLAPLLSAEVNLAVLHGNKPQVGFVLFRSEVASHVLHTVPLDVCGADTQGATGYMIAQSLRNALSALRKQRSVVCVLTQTLVEATNLEQAPLKAIGPWFDRDKAEHYRQMRKWKIIEEPGRGYRRGVPSLTPRAILEMDVIKNLVDEGKIVIAAGGGGIPVTYNAQGLLEGIEGVIDTEPVACMVAQHLSANILVIVVDREEKFILSGLMKDKTHLLSLTELDDLLSKETIRSATVQGILRAAAEFLHQGGEQVMISTLSKLRENLLNGTGLRIGSPHPSVEQFTVTQGQNQ